MRDEIYDIMKQHSEGKFAADRRRFLEDAMKPENNDGGWTEHTKYHWSRTVDGHRLDYWPSRKKWQYKGKVKRGLKAMNTLIGAVKK